MRRKVGICSFEIDGPKRGGIGTAYASLAKVLAAAGHDVTLVFAGDRYETGGPEHWRAHYARRGVTFEGLPPLAEAVDPQTPWPLPLSYRAYRHLRERDFEIVHFPEALGVGFYSLLAARQGLAFRNTVLAVGTHGPSRWVREANANASFQKPRVAAVQDVLERRCVEMADVLISPSAYLYRWMEESGWTLAEPRHVLQNVLRPSSSSPTPPTASLRIEEIVFFGRLETRKGLALFCEAIERVLAGGPERPRVTFLGWNAKDAIDGLPPTEWLAKRTAGWPATPLFLTDLDRAGALAYLRGPGRLAVMPSPVTENSPYTVLECLDAGLPFVTTDVGGIPELVRVEDRSAACVRPTPEALAARLAEVLRGPQARPRPARDPADTRRAWIEWHESLPPASRPATAPGEELGLVVDDSEEGVFFRREMLRDRKVAPGGGAFSRLLRGWRRRLTSGE